MTREQIEQIVRSVERTCKGPPLWSADEQADFLRYIQLVQEGGAGALERARRKVFETQQLLKNMLGLAHPFPIPWALDTPQEVIQTLVYLMRLHGRDVGRGCGYDFNNIILANPLDGQEHEYTCPACGATGSYRAPLFE